MTGRRPSCRRTFDGSALWPETTDGQCSLSGSGRHSSSSGSDAYRPFRRIQDGWKINHTHEYQAWKKRKFSIWNFCSQHRHNLRICNTRRVPLTWINSLHKEMAGIKTRSCFLCPSLIRNLSQPNNTSGSVSCPEGNLILFFKWLLSCFHNVEISTTTSSISPFIYHKIHYGISMLIVCGVSLMSGQLITELFPDCLKVMLFGLKCLT